VHVVRQVGQAELVVSLHQDLSIPVAERVDSPRYVGWSEKKGEVCVQPPVPSSRKSSRSESILMTVTRKMVLSA
jgi:hypothetical protein